jgi:hypothetical protein
MAQPLRKNKKGKRRQSAKRAGMIPVETINTQPETSFPMLSQLPMIVPDRIRTKVSYSENVNLTTIFASQPGVQIWSGNAVYDPDVTGVGGTCKGVSQLRALYNYVTVVRSKARLTLINGVTSPVRAVVLPSTFTITNANLTADLAEQARAQEFFLGSNAGGHDVAKHNRECATADIWGVPPMTVISETDYAADPTASRPVNQWYWCLSVLSLSGVALGFNAEMTITYDCIWYRRIIL